MKREYSPIWVILLCCLLFGSTSFAQSKKKMKKMMNACIGRTKQELMILFGLPQTTVSDENGGEIVVFSDRIYYDYWTVATQYSQSVHMHADYYKNKMFFVGTDGKVYAWRYYNTPNPPQTVDINMNINSTQH
jgi:hypothetical protein